MSIWAIRKEEFIASPVQKKEQEAEEGDKWPLRRCPVAHNQLDVLWVSRTDERDTFIPQQEVELTHMKVYKALFWL